MTHLALARRAEGNPFGDAEGNPFGDAEGNPFGDAEGNPFGDAEGNPFGEAGGKAKRRQHLKPRYKLSRAFRKIRTATM